MTRRLVFVVLLQLGFGISAALSAGIATKTITCADGTEVFMESACGHRGGVKAQPIGAKPIKISKAAGASSAAITKAQGSSQKIKKPKSRTLRSPTAKCLDGAFYYSTEKIGACTKHGGVDKWYGW